MFCPPPQGRWREEGKGGWREEGEGGGGRRVREVDGGG